jgi:hypothetical protein
MSRDQRRTFGAVLAITGGLLIAAGAFLPWAYAGVTFLGVDVAKSGMEGGDGVVFLGAGLVVAVVGLWSLLGRPTLAPFLLIVGALAVGLGAIVEYGDVDERAVDIERLGGGAVDVAVGAGIWTMFAGAALALIAGLVLVGQMKAPNPSDTIGPRFSLGE